MRIAFAVSGVQEDVVRAHDTLSDEGRVEHGRGPWHPEPIKLGPFRAGQGIKHVALARVVQHVVEERPEPGLRELHASVGDLLNDPLTVKARGHHGTRAVQRFQGVGLGPQRFGRRALFGDVSVDADPFADRAGPVECRNGSDGEEPPLAIAPAEPVLEAEGPALGHGLGPGVDRGLRVIRVQGRCPAVALIISMALARQGGPAKLLASHAADGVVGPDRPLHRADRGTEAGVAFPQGLQSLPRFVLAPPGPQGRAGEAHEGRRMEGPLEERDVAQHLQVALSGRVALQSSTMGGQQHERQVGPFLLIGDPGRQWGEVGRDQDLLGDDHEARPLIELSDQVRQGCAGLRRDPGLTQHRHRDRGIPASWRQDQRTMVDPGELENALVNLAVNARDAMPNGVKLTIETANAYLDEGYIETVLEPVPPGRYVLVAVSDIVMDSDTLGKVFETFFTTKEVGKATGLGLRQVYGFVRQTGGHVRIYSEPGVGTTVKIYLPRAADDLPSAPAETARPTMAIQGGSETILLVEDHDDLRSFSTGVLAELGYRVLAASNGAEALWLLDAGHQVDLLFTDVVLPAGLDGRQLANEALARRPGLKVLFTTGYTRNAIVHNGRLDPGVELISKPFTSEALAAKVRAILDR